MLLIFIIQNMAVHRFTAEEVVAILQQEPDEEDEEAFFSDSESEISDDDDPEYLQGCGLAGAVCVSTAKSNLQGHHGASEI